MIVSAAAVRDRLGRYPTLVDAAIAIAVFAASVPVLVDHHRGCGCRFTPWWGYALLVASCALLLLRRRYPFLVGAVVGTLTGIYGATALPDPPLPFAGLVAIYSAAAYARPRRAALTAAGTAVGITISLALDRRSTVQDWSLISLVFATSFLLGYAARTRRDAALALEQRAAFLERSRSAEAERAVAAERSRIAREMHDVVAHAVSLMVVQAEAGPVVLGSDPARASTVFDTISSTGRQALVEMRRVLGVLREADRPDTGDRAPQPGVAALDQLVASFADTGLRVRLRAERLDVEDSIAGLAVYRIVQESLTNVLKHAGATNVDVDVRQDVGTWSVVVTDDGRGTPATDTGGNGLRGMRDRAELLGGTLEAGPRTGGGWRVRAVVPASTTPTPPTLPATQTAAAER